MALKAFRGRPFEHTHENLAYNRLFDLLHEHCIATEQDWYLIGNVYVGSRELDAILLKPNALIIIDFKDFSGALEFSEDGPWLMNRAKEAGAVVVKGGASINPLRQLRLNKAAVMDFLSRHLPELNPLCNWRHTAALVAFEGVVEFDRQQLPGSIKPWFHISDPRTIVRDLDAIVSKEIALSPQAIQRIVGTLSIDPFIPAGTPAIRSLGETPNGITAAARLTTLQGAVLENFRHWLQAGTGVFRLTGMASTGKRSLFPYLIEALSRAGAEVLMLTPSARLSSNYVHPQAQPTSIYTWLYSRQPTRFEKQDGRKVAIHELKEDLCLEDRIPVLVDAHLLSDEMFEAGDKRYGSGRLLQDFLSVVARTKTAFVIIGDPYQTPRGSLQRSLVGGPFLEQAGLVVTSAVLTEQIVEDEDDALCPFQAHLADSIGERRFNRLPRRGGKRLEILGSDHARRWAPDLANVQAESILICATHEQNTKLNAAVKTKVLGHADPVRLGPGDRIDFYNRTPILRLAETVPSLEAERWIAAGDLALVDSVDDSVETHCVELRGRKVPIPLRFQCASCRLPGRGEVRFRYLLDYFEAERPDLAGDQYLALQVLARQLAWPQLKPLKAKLPDKKDPGYAQAKAEYDRQEYRILQTQGYLCAALIRPAHVMTLHRAQGRRWPTVWINAVRSASSTTANNMDYFRWLYTASVLAKEACIIRQMPVLTPLSNARISRAHDMKTGPFPLRRGLFYDPTRQITQEESSLPAPVGLTQAALLPLFLTLSERLCASNWCIAQWSEHSYQVIVDLTHRQSDASVRVRMHYDKKLAITNLVLAGGKQEDQDAIEELLCQPFKPNSEALAQALDAIQEQTGLHGFCLVEAKEFNYRLQLTLTLDNDAIEIQVDCDKEGMISSVRIQQASSSGVIECLERTLAVAV